MSSTPRPRAHYGEPELLDEEVEDLWLTEDEWGYDIRPRRPRRGRPMAVVPAIILGVIALAIGVRILQVLTAPLMFILMPIGMIMMMFWPVVLIVTLGWGISRVSRAKGRYTTRQPTIRWTDQASHGAGRSARGYQQRRPSSSARRYGEPAQRGRHRPASVPEMSPADAGMMAVLGRGWAMLDRARPAVRQFPDIAVRTRAAAVVDQAEQILDALRERQGGTALATRFVDRYLGPTTTILERYVRLANSGVGGAKPTLDRVAEHDLPMIERKFRELYERLYGGDLLDLQVASEMLEFDLGDPHEAAGDHRSDVHGPVKGAR